MDDKTLQNVGEQVAKRKRPDRTEAMTPHTQEGDNAKYIAHNLKIATLPQINIDNPKEIEQRIVEYFSICEQNDMKPSKAGMALALGIDRTYLWKIETGNANKSQEVVNTIKKYVVILDAYMNDLMQSGQINTIAAIFLMKNNFNYSDKQEIEVKAQSPLGDTNDTKELEDRYKDSVIIEEDGTTVINE